ncbi:ornithine cyclodeaminase family protein [Cytobacillus sp. NCCP-133]|uniref:ornithine cyclodeaminase family protein n=1 Tax=Cytobacillus sp. NCCP-133 TaxID=766848 RepID=UPI0022326981|nr:ornithine cyclodeaminase family protein [Cytobacillus sp. NCCP-133]GLB59177.1 ornithine cyclodeaminase [Cytobacillus sp. NCCP-133]
MLILNEQLIQSIYKIEDAIRDVEAMLVAIHQGHVDNPQRTVLNVPESNGSVLYMPSSDGTSMAATKIVSIFPDNSSANLPTTQGAILLTELETGRHISLLSASYLTRLRTGALSAISARHLARPDSQVLTVIGTGGMAFEQVLGLVNVLPIQDIYLINRSIEKTFTFSEKLKEAGVTATIHTGVDRNEAVVQSDVICCATRSTEEVFNADYVKAGTHIIGVGSYLPEMREIPLGAIERAALIYADDYEGITTEGGEFIDAVQRGKWSFDQLSGTLAELHANQVERRFEDITIFKSVGAAHFDLAVAKGVFEKVKELNEGEEIFL